MLETLADSKFNTKMNKKYDVNTKFFSPMNSSQLSGVPSWRNQQIIKFSSN